LCASLTLTMSMDSVRYQKVKGLFFAALELPAAERESFIERSCGQDLELRAELRKLIEAHDSAASFLSDPAVSLDAISSGEGQPRFQPGMQLAGRFRILRFISSGGMGEVYEAEDLELHVRVALKTIRSRIAGEEKILELFKHEIQLARRVTHPNVCRTFDLSRHSEVDADGTEHAVHFLSMELLDGKSLSQHVKEHGPFGAAEAMPLIEQMAAALQAAHDAGVIHRDFKPGNVMLVPRGAEGDLRAVVTDFGLALPSVESHRRVNAEAGKWGGGTPGYMAPEQSDGGIVTAATDVYSLGTVIAEMIGGKRSEERRSLLSTLMPVSERDHAVSLRLPDSCAGWRPALERCVEVLPERRFQKPIEVVATLRSIDPRKSRLRWLRRPALVERRGKSGALSRQWRRAALLLTLGIAAAVPFASRWWAQVPPPSVTQTVQLTSDRHPKWFRLVTDGARIYFSEREKNRWIPAAVSTRGGEPVGIPTPFMNTIVQDISPKGTELLVTSSEQELPEPLSRANPLWVIPTEGGKPHRLGGLEVLEARWSPDGGRLLYIRGNDVYLAKSDGTGSRKLVSMPSPPYFPSWSPDGKRLSLSVVDPQTSRPALWELNADGSNLHPRLAGWGGEPFDCNGTWTPNGKYFLFDSFRGGPDSIWAVRERGSWFERWSREPMRLSSGPMSAGKPVASKDGRRIFFLADTGKVSRLSRYDAKSGDWSPYLSGISAEQVDFSRDGQWVAYTSILGANLVRSRMDGSQRLQLTSPPVEAANPRWSPDGEKIAFIARYPGKKWKIHIVSSDGSGLQPLLPGEFDERDPGWSPDGHSLVFASDRDFQTSPKPPMLFVLDLQTNQILPVPGSWDRWMPRWSPDGRFLADIVNCQNVMLFDFKTRRWVELANGGEFYWPSWSQDSQYVYFIDWKTESGVYDRVGIRDLKRERVAKLDRELAIDIFGGGWVGLTPDGAPLAPIVDRTTEVFAFDWRAP
jgi:eukaryotic-like serine/threonine-protein kinase